MQMLQSDYMVSLQEPPNPSTQKDNSMFKNAIVYRINQHPKTLGITERQEILQAHAFAPCYATQEKSMGWVPPRGEAHGSLIENIGGHHILKLMTETKAVPGQALKREVDRMCADIEKATGRKPGKKDRRELKEDALLAMLPGAFPKQSATLVWIDPRDSRIVIDASSQSKADDVVTMLLKSFEGLELQMINTVLAPAASMAHWLTDDEPYSGEHSFEVGRECELKANDESKAVVKYGRHRLDTGEVTEHIRTGKMPTKLALTWDGRVSFVLTEGLQIKKIQLLDGVFEGGDKDEDRFDADVAIFTGEMARMLPALFAVLGGEVEAA